MYCLIGLVTLDEMRARQEDVVKARERQLVVNQSQSRLDSDDTTRKKRKKNKIKQVIFKSDLFFHSMLKQYVLLLYSVLNITAVNTIK